MEEASCKESLSKKQGKRESVEIVDVYKKKPYFSLHDVCMSYHL